MDDFWYMKVESIVFDRIKKKSKDYLSKYPDLIFTSEEVTQTPTKFPCVEIRELQGVEQGITLDNEYVSGYLSTFQINVYDNKSKQIARDVMEEVISHFKKDLHFSIVTMPIHTNNGDIHRYIARVRRMIGGGDKL